MSLPSDPSIAGNGGASAAVQEGTIMSVEMSWALDIMTGARIEIDSPGPTGLACGCKCAGPCSQPVEAVNRGKVEGTYERTPHFRHPKGNTRCNGPTPHDLAVLVAAERLGRDIADDVPTVAEYDCECQDRYTVNVLELNGKAVQAVANQFLRNYWPTERRIEPDIMLVAKQDGGVATIEVVYSHQPEEHVLAEGHPVLVVPISTEQDARALSSGVIHAGRLHNVACLHRAATPAQVELASPADRVGVLSESLGRYSHPHGQENAKCVPCYDAWPQKARPHQCGWITAALQ